MKEEKNFIFFHFYIMYNYYFVLFRQYLTDIGNSIQNVQRHSAFLDCLNSIMLRNSNNV